MGIPNLRTCHFEASEDIMTKFKNKLFIPQESNIKKLVGVATFPPSFLTSGKLPFMYVLKMKFIYFFAHDCIENLMCNVSFWQKVCPVISIAFL